MSSSITSALVSALKKLTMSLETGEINCSTEQQEAILDQLATFNTHRHLSKEQACHYLQVSRATFDNLVKSGKLPKGKKTLGFKELSWKLQDLDKYKSSDE